MQPIETKEIKGLSAKTLGWLISSTIILVVAVYGNYSLLKAEISTIENRINTVQQQKTADDRLVELKITILETNLKQVQVQIDNLRNEVNTNRRQIEGAK